VHENVPRWESTGKITVSGIEVSCFDDAEAAAEANTDNTVAGEAASNDMVVGYYAQSWGGAFVGPEDTNMGICFNGYESVDEAISQCTQVVDTLQPVKWISIGGNGDPNGKITADVLSNAASSADTFITAGYTGVLFDAEMVEGTNEALTAGFSSASETLVGKGLQVGVTTSHSGPFQVTGGADAATLVKGWVADPNMAVLSPQLYSADLAITSPEFDTTSSCTACTWDIWKGSAGAFAPSIVDASQYDATSTYFNDNFGIQTQGYIIFPGSSPGPAPSGNDKMCGASWDDANSDCSKACPGGTDAECDSGQSCWGDITGCA
jgi:hypothetical protein